MVDLGFRFTVICKGLSGLAEILGGVGLFFLNPLRMYRLLSAVAQGILSRWPLLEDALLQYAANFSRDTQLFGIAYLLSHGVIKCVLMVLLWREKWWAYPLAILSLVGFIVYQLTRIAVKPTFAMIFLTVFDTAMIFLTVQEYRQIRRRARSKAA